MGTDSPPRNRRNQPGRKADRKAALEEAAQLAQVADFYEEPRANGFEFSNEEIDAHLHRTDNLKRYAWHQNTTGIPRSNTRKPPEPPNFLTGHAGMKLVYTATTVGF